MPNRGGPSDIVGHQGLCYRSTDEAVEKIHRALNDTEHASELRNHLTGRGDRFTPEVFIEGVRSLVREFAARRLGEHAA